VSKRINAKGRFPRRFRGTGETGCLGLPGGVRRVRGTLSLVLGARLGKLFESPCMVPPASLDVPRNGRVDGQALVGNAAMVARETTVTATRFVTSTGMSL